MALETLHGLEDLARIPGRVHLAIGFFDGVHRGHAAVLDAARECATRSQSALIATTFEPHPLQVLRPQEAPALLTGLAHKASLMNQLGVGHLLVLPFSREMAALSPEAFTDSLVNAGPVLTGITVGEGWAFGRGRSGNVASLTRLGLQHGFEVQGVPPVKLMGEPVSSTRVRRAVECGDFALAAELLGRPWSLQSTVIKGRQLARKLGFPTANLETHGLQMPPHGVYAIRAVFHDGRTYSGVANAGHRPTVDRGSAVHLEAHLFDYTGDCYGGQLELIFHQRLRGEVRFDSLDELQAQISRDTAAARRALSSEPLPA